MPQPTAENGFFERSSDREREREMTGWRGGRGKKDEDENSRSSGHPREAMQFPVADRFATDSCLDADDFSKEERRGVEKEVTNEERKERKLDD